MRDRLEVLDELVRDTDEMQRSVEERLAAAKAHVAALSNELTVLRVKSEAYRIAQQRFAAASDGPAEVAAITVPNEPVLADAHADAESDDGADTKSESESESDGRKFRLFVSHSYGDTDFADTLSDWASMPRTFAVERAVREIVSQPNMDWATPKDVEEVLAAHGRDDSNVDIWSALSYLRRKERIQNRGRGRWMLTMTTQTSEGTASAMPSDLQEEGV